jgi:hypothetical protein
MKHGVYEYLPNKGMIWDSHPDEISVRVEVPVEQWGPGEYQGDWAGQQALQHNLFYSHLVRARV